MNKRNLPPQPTKLKWPLVAKGQYIFDSAGQVVLVAMALNAILPEGKTRREFAKWTAEALNTAKQNEDQQELG